MGLTFKMELTGADSVKAVLKQLEADAGPAMRAALYQEGTELLNESKELCPIDTGTLIGSAYIEESNNADVTTPEVIVGYGGAAAPYALSVHENPRSGHTGGVSPSGRKYKHWAQVGQWKYLETPFKSRVTGFDDRIGAFLRARLLKGG